MIKDEWVKVMDIGKCLKVDNKISRTALKDKRKAVVVMLLAFLFTVMQVVGYWISMFYGTTVHQSDFLQNIGILSGGQSVLLAIMEFPVWCVILFLLFTVIEKTVITDRSRSRRSCVLLWAIISVLLFLCWIPCLRAGYPGFYNYDAMDQVPQVLYDDVPYSAHHPLLHTLIMGGIIKFGYLRGADLNDGIILYSIFQMIVCAAAFGYMICYVLKITGKRWLSILAFGYYGFFPVIAMFAMSTTKDTIFSILLQLGIIFVYDMGRDIQGFFSSKGKILRLIITLSLICLFRKNGMYVVIAMIPLAAMFWKEKWKQICLLFGSAVLVYLIVNNSLIWALDAEKGSAEEALCVPIQQVARVYRDCGEEAFKEEELALIYEGIPKETLANYNPFLADGIKNYFDFNVVQDNKMDYLLLWIKKGLQYPKEYIKAFLENTYQAWYPGTSIYDSPNAAQTYYFGMNMCAGGYRDSKDTGLLEFYEKIATGYYYQKLPGVRLLFSIGAMLWAALFVWSFAVYQKNRPLIAAMSMALLCCFTVFLGPVSLVRYYLVLFYGFPVSMAFMLRGKKW